MDLKVFFRIVVLLGLLFTTNKELIYQRVQLKQLLLHLQQLLIGEKKQFH
jgi:hypothetical protein